jgi:hypothetical protein
MQPSMTERKVISSLSWMLAFGIYRYTLFVFNNLLPPLKGWFITFITVTEQHR